VQTVSILIRGGLTMIEIAMHFELLPGKDQNAYAELAKAVVAMALEAPGVIEVRGNRNMLGAPQVRFTTVWRSLVDWARFNESTEWQEAWAEMNPYLTNLTLEIWGPSPIVPGPLRPGE
jgi:heme-degrading monooxygenase HmoA